MKLSPLDSIGDKTSLNLDIDNAVNSNTLFRKAEKILERNVIFFNLSLSQWGSISIAGNKPLYKTTVQF